MEVELLGRLRRGEEEAFAQLVDRYQPRMLRLACAMAPNRAVAEEAVQETWLALLRGVGQFEGRSSLKTWLFQVLANRTRTAASKEHPATVLDELGTVDPSRFDERGQWSDPPAHWLEESENRLDAAAWSPILRVALDALPARQREVVLLRDVEGLSSEEVCAVLGISPGNQRILLHRGRARLRGILEAEMAKG